MCVWLANCFRQNNTLQKPLFIETSIQTKKSLSLSFIPIQSSSTFLSQPDPAGRLALRNASTTDSQEKDPAPSRGAIRKRATGSHHGRRHRVRDEDRQVLVQKPTQTSLTPPKRPKTEEAIHVRMPAKAGRSGERRKRGREWVAAGIRILWAFRNRKRDLYQRYAANVASDYAL